MASTGSYNFVVTRDNLITDAHLHICAIGEGESCTANQVTEAARLLNMLVKLRAADRMPAWALKRGIILPVTGTSSITTASHIVSAYDETAIAADAAAGTSITVDVGSNIADSDQIGIEQDDGTMHWTTVSSGGGTTSLVLAATLTDTVSDGNKVYSYTASTQRISSRPLRILGANILETTSDASWSIEIEDNADYYSLGNRTSPGVPNLIYYDAGMGSEVADPATAAAWYGTFYIYPRFSGGDHVIEFTYQRPFQDFDASTDNPDFPQEFYLPLMLELAALLGPKFGVPRDERRALFAEAKMYRDEALTTVAPEGSLSIIPGDQNR